MECTNPLHGYQVQDGSVVFSDFGRADVIRDLTLRCGQCMACRVTRAGTWSVRCMHESKLHGARNSFVTLTYDNDHLPAYGNLQYRDFQLFMKRLRKHVGDDRVRFRLSAEFGDLSFRPHYHFLGFNLWPDDARKWRSTSGGYLYRSAELEKLWPLGNVEFGLLTPETSAYVNGYVMKKLTGAVGDEAYRRIDVDTGEVIQLTSPFGRQSTLPAIGVPFFERYLADFVNADGCVSRGGVKVGLPKAYDNWLEKHLPEQLEELKFSRELLGRERFLAAPEEFSPARLAVKEECVRARVAGRERSAI